MLWGRKALGFLVPLLCAGPTAALTIGPDAFGYHAFDVASPFEDISGSGTGLLAGADDEATGLISLGFNFDFYGTTYSDIFWSTNGFAGFGATTFTEFQNRNLDLEAPELDVPLIAVLWDDWEFDSDRQVDPPDQTYYQLLGPVGNQRFVIQWNRAMGFSDSPSTVTFQVVLFEGSNDIEFRYADTFTGTFRDDGGSATVGIRNTAGHQTGEKLQWHYGDADNGPCDQCPPPHNPVSGGQSIRWSLNGPPPAPEPSTLLLLGGGALGLFARRRKRNQRSAHLRG
jgi:hypothetical protein